MRLAAVLTLLIMAIFAASSGNAVAVRSETLVPITASTN
jgi:hypothetical protein